MCDCCSANRYLNLRKRSFKYLGKPLNRFHINKLCSDDAPNSSGSIERVQKNLPKKTSSFDTRKNQAYYDRLAARLSGKGNDFCNVKVFSAQTINTERNSENLPQRKSTEKKEDLLQRKSSDKKEDFLQRLCKGRQSKIENCGCDLEPDVFARCMCYKRKNGCQLGRDSCNKVLQGEDENEDEVFPDTEFDYESPELSEECIETAFKCCNCSENESEDSTEIVEEEAEEEEEDVVEPTEIAPDCNKCNEIEKMLSEKKVTHKCNYFSMFFGSGNKYAYRPVRFEPCDNDNKVKYPRGICYQTQHTFRMKGRTDYCIRKKNRCPEWDFPIANNQCCYLIC